MVRRPLIVAIAAILLTSCATSRPNASDGASPQLDPLPSPETDGELALEAALATRRSVRAFATQALSEAQIGQLLWAAQGVTGGGGGRTAPSAGATYPLELYVATADGLRRYHPDGHATELIGAEDVRGDLAEAGLGQEALRQAPAIFAVVAVTERTAARYGDRAERYVQLEAGHAAQNLLLQAVSLGLGAVPIGSFEDDAVSSALRLGSGAAPLYLIPVGRPEG